MKKLILAASITLITTSVFASETAVLKVTGTLTNASCSPELGDGGVIDYGYIHLGSLSASENNVIGEKQIPVTIQCTAPTKVGFTMLDNNSDSNAQLPVDIGSYKSITYSYYTYGAGTTSEDVKIGNYGLWITDVVADSNTVDALTHNGDWRDGKWQMSPIPRNDDLSTTTFGTTGTTTPIAVTTVNFNIVTNLVIRDTATLAITDDTPIDGQTTMTLVYL